MELAALDIRYATLELQRLVGAKVEKVVQSDTEKRDLLFTLYKPGLDRKVLLRFILPSLVCTHDTKPDSYPQIPPGFAMFLRKYLTKLTRVEQAGFDRIIKLYFEGKTGSWTLVAEFLPPGNMILIDADGKIKNLLENQVYKDRSLRGGLPYAQPPAAFNLTTATDEGIAQRICAALKQSVAAALATALGLGGVYAEEACARARVDKACTELTADGIHALVRAVRDLLAQEIVPHKDASRVYPFRLESRATAPCPESSFLAAIGASLGVSAPSAPSSKPKKSKAQAMLDAQEANLATLHAVAAEEQRKADRIYEEYSLIKEVIDTAQAARREKNDVAHVLKRFAAVKRYDPATATVEIELEDRA